MTDGVHMKVAPEDRTKLLAALEAESEHGK
jgi:hypothetical protein